MNNKFVGRFRVCTENVMCCWSATYELYPATATTFFDRPIATNIRNNKIGINRNGSIKFLFASINNNILFSSLRDFRRTSQREWWCEGAKERQKRGNNEKGS